MEKDPGICCLQQDCFSFKDTHDWKWRNGKLFHAKQSQKRAGAAILLLGKIYFKAETVTRDKDGHYIKIKGLIHQEDLTVVNTYALNIRAPKCIKQTEFIDQKESKNENTIHENDKI